MKKSLGSFLILFLSFLSLDASTYKWSSFVETEKAYVGEAIYIKYLCEFDDNGELYIIDFEPRSSDLYDVILLRRDEKLRDGKRTNSYEYILKAKLPKDLEIVLEATMKKTSLDSIVDNTTNHYDDTKFDSIHTKTIVKMKKITVEILDVPKKLLGTFGLKVKKDEPNIKAYEPYHLDVKISGEGSFDALESIDFTIDGVKVFTQKPTKKIDLDKDGYKGSWMQKFAFVSGEDFRIPARSIEYFDMSSNRVQVLEIDAVDVKVQVAYKKSDLLDDVEEDFSLNIEYAYYLFTLIAGFLVGKIKFKTKKVNTETEKFITKVNETKSLDVLSMLLILTNEKKFSDILGSIDSNEVTSLRQAKKMIIKIVS
ncbi:MAG: hypothetical protein ACI9TV_001838 [Sulfurimonas sp.]|jgi:hypothetical protein|uniref:hypothetical protein n=1 Tax=Sulfurimonas sp. TaxID=2022749 RepID=UPI0039E3EC0F